MADIWSPFCRACEPYLSDEPDWPRLVDAGPIEAVRATVGRSMPEFRPGVGAVADALSAATFWLAPGLNNFFYRAAEWLQPLRGEERAAAMAEFRDLAGRFPSVPKGLLLGLTITAEGDLQVFQNQLADVAGGSRAGREDLACMVIERGLLIPGLCGLTPPELVVMRELGKLEDAGPSEEAYLFESAESAIARHGGGDALAAGAEDLIARYPGEYAAHLAQRNDWRGGARRCQEILEEIVCSSSEDSPDSSSEGDSAWDDGGESPPDE